MLDSFSISHFGTAQVPNNKLSFAKQVLCGEGRLEEGSYGLLILHPQRITAKPKSRKYVEILRLLFCAYSVMRLTF